MTKYPGSKERAKVKDKAVQIERRVLRFYGIDTTHPDFRRTIPDGSFVMSMFTAGFSAGYKAALKKMGESR